MDESAIIEQLEKLIKSFGVHIRSEPIKQDEDLVNPGRSSSRQPFTPAAESHGLWPWMNAPALGRDVAPLGRSLGATGFARGAPPSERAIGSVDVYPIPIESPAVLGSSLSHGLLSRTNRTKGC
jgi:hypothetical protein